MNTKMSNITKNYFNVEDQMYTPRNKQNIPQKTDRAQNVNDDDGGCSGRSHKKEKGFELQRSCLSEINFFKR